MSVVHGDADECGKSSNGWIEVDKISRYVFRGDFVGCLTERVENDVSQPSGLNTANVGLNCGVKLKRTANLSQPVWKKSSSSPRGKGMIVSTAVRTN